MKKIDENFIYKFNRNLDTHPTSYLIILLKATTTHQSKASIKDKSKADIVQACTKSLVCSLSCNVNPTQTL